MKLIPVLIRLPALHVFQLDRGNPERREGMQFVRFGNTIVIVIRPQKQRR